jgi:predicted lipoprotein with Yx(FWY)xxD motif
VRNRTLLAVGVLAAVAVAGCGSSSNSSSNSTSTPTTASTPSAGGASGAVAISTAKNPKLGNILVGADGKTLYYFEKDKGGKSSCYSACATVWPPVITTGKPTAGKGAIASKLGTTKRKDGTMQATYAGFPLYDYVKDAKPGDTLGNNLEQFGAEWYALTPAGTKPKGS